MVLIIISFTPVIFYRNTLSWFKEHASEKTKSLTERLKGLSMRQIFRQTYIFFWSLKSVYFQFYGASVHSQEKFQSKSCHRSVHVFFLQSLKFFRLEKNESLPLSAWKVSLLRSESLGKTVSENVEKIYRIFTVLADQLQGSFSFKTLIMFLDQQILNP